MVEIGCIEMINRVPAGEVFHAYFNPDRDMPAAAEAVHGLSIQFLSDKPLFATRVDELMEFLGDAPLILPSGPHGLRSTLDAAFARARVTPNLVLEVDSLAMLMDAVSAGLGGTLQPWAAVARCADAHTRFHMARITDAGVTRENWLCALSEEELSPAALAARAAEVGGVHFIREHGQAGDAGGGTRRPFPVPGDRGPRFLHAARERGPLGELTGLQVAALRFARCGAGQITTPVTRQARRRAAEGRHRSADLGLRGGGTGRPRRRRGEDGGRA